MHHYFNLWLLFSHQVMSESLQPYGLQQRQASLSFPISQSLLKFDYFNKSYQIYKIQKTQKKGGINTEIVFLVGK